MKHDYRGLQTWRVLLHHCSPTASLPPTTKLVARDWHPKAHLSDRTLKSPQPAGPQA